MSATLRALLCITSAAASLEWKRIPVPPPSQFHLVSSDGASLAVVTSSDQRQRFRLANDTAWNVLPVDFGAGFCWDKKCLRFRDGSNPVLLGMDGTGTRKTFGGIGQATSGTLLWRARPYREGRLVLACYHTARYGQAIFLGLDTVTAPGDSTLVWRRIRSPDSDTTLEYTARLIGSRIYYQSDRNPSGSSTPSKTSWSADSGRTWSDLGFETRNLEGWKDTVLAVTAGWHLAVSTDGGKSWDSTASAPRESVEYEVLAGRLWMMNPVLRRVAWSTDRGRSWIECPGAIDLPQFDGNLLRAEGETGIVISDPGEIRWKPETGQYAVDALVDVHPFADGYLATTTKPNWIDVLRLVRRSRGTWAFLDERTEVFHSGRSEVLAWRKTDNGGRVLERSTDARIWSRIDTIGSYWQGWYIASDEHGRFLVHDGNGMRLSTDGGISWIRHLPEIKGVYADDFCNPYGFDRQSRPICNLDGASYRFEGNGWAMLPDSSTGMPLGLRSEFGRASRKPGGAYSVHRYRDSLLVITDSIAWIAWTGGQRKFATNGEPAGARFAAWVPGGGSTDADSVLLVQDTSGNLWEGRERATASAGRESPRKARVRLEGNALVVELEERCPNLEVRSISVQGRNSRVLRMGAMEPGTHRIPMEPSKGVRILELFGPGVRATLAMPAI